MRFSVGAGMHPSGMDLKRRTMNWRIGKSDAGVKIDIRTNSQLTRGVTRVSITDASGDPVAGNIDIGTQTKGECNMTLSRCASLGGLALAVWFAADAQAQTLRLTPDHTNGYYQAGATVRWQVVAEGAVSNEVGYVVKSGGLIDIAKGKTSLRAGKGGIESRLAAPGTLLLEATAFGVTGEIIRALSGAAFSADQIQPSSPRPPDFDSFWQAKLDELAAVPTNSVLTPVGCDRPNVDYWQIAMDNIRNTHIRGQIARPKQGQHLPALLIVQWSGVYPLQAQWVVDRAAAGWLALNINAHDLPIDQPNAFYSAQSAAALKDYCHIGRDDREKSYFLRMYLSCFRAADYLAHRPDWDGRTLVVTGMSQGGMQAFVTAGLHPRVTAVLAEVPAGCDMQGPKVGRAPGWPFDAGPYYDVVNFASRIKCPVLAGVGLIDTTCPPAGVFAACKQLAGPREIVLLPNGGHGEQGQNHSHAPYRTRFDAWMSALRQGQPPPPACIP